MAHSNSSKYFSPTVSGILTTIGGSGILFLNLAEGNYFQVALGLIVLVSGIGMLIKAKK